MWLLSTFITFIHYFVFFLSTWGVVVLSGGAPTPAGTSVFSKHNWDMEMGYLWLNGWCIYHLMGGAFMAHWVVMEGAFISLNEWGIYDLMGWAFMGRAFIT